MIEKQIINKQKQKDIKTKIYNLLIVDESGSMSSLVKATKSGVNETINTIREAQKQHADEQEHYLTLVTFDERHRADYPAVRTLYDCVPIAEVEDFTNYNPCGCTPLYDAMGQSLERLSKRISKDDDTVGVVTILTDGLENASMEWDASKLRKLIEQLKEMGWAFSYMGSDHDVRDVTSLLSIDNAVAFSHDEKGTASVWERESSAKFSFFSSLCGSAEMSKEERVEKRKSLSSNYYGRRVTPDNIRRLAPDEVFVFGSDPDGIHTGGAALFALRRFGARMGQGEGMQGQSYGIPSTDGLELLESAARRFCEYAREHPEMHFLVTRIGCGTARLSVRDVAPMFRAAVGLENVSLPMDFWRALGLEMY